MTTLSEHRAWLMELARRAGDRYYDPRTQRCLISRDTIWYAIALLFDTEEDRRRLGNHLLSTVPAEDATHTPATMLAILLHVQDLAGSAVCHRLDNEVRKTLPGAAACEWHDGNVNHPLAAYTTLVLGGERFHQPWAVDLGLHRLRRFRERIGEHRSLIRRQAEMSEYNSLTYTALDLWFLALIAEHARTDEARSVALFLEQRLWTDVAMHFHAPSHQFSGPHSRSYADDSFGGCSALHFTMLAASGVPLFIEPEQCLRFCHPSTLIQNSLVALIPFHFPDTARVIAWEKPYPYSFTKTTYGERYHENSHRTDITTTGAVERFVFDDEVYPGGWSELTTYMTEEYALGSASLPYVNGGHSDSVMLRIRRNGTISRLDDQRSAWTRGVFNGSRPGVRNFAHVAKIHVDESYLYEEGRPATYQHENRLIACYHPKRAGHTGVESYRTDLIFGYAAPFDCLLIDGRECERFPVRCSGNSKILFRDYRTFGLIIPFPPWPAGSDTPVLVWRSGEFLLVSMYNCEGAPHDFSRHAINGWRTGFALELSTAGETDWDSFVSGAETGSVEEWTHDGSLRSVRFSSRGNVMEFTYDPFKESIVERLWNGSPEQEVHFSVRAGNETTGLFCPPSIFGNEVMP